MSALNTLRGRLLAAGAVPALIVVVLVVDVLLTMSGNAAGRDDYDQGSYRSAASAFAGNRGVNLFQRWVAPFNEGTARHRAEAYPEAIDAYLAALKTVPIEHECTVAINLALSHEAAGDGLAEQDPAGAVEHWQAGRDALADHHCLTDPGGGDRQREQAQAVDDRLAEKLGPQDQPQPDQPDDQPADPEEQSREDRLAERNGRAQEERRDQEDLDDYLDSGSDGGATW